jgi:type IV pilus assembly protein PilW
VQHPIGRPSPQSGIGLIELMVAMVIGLFLIFGAVTIYQQSRSTFRTSEAVARLQEVGRLAMDVIESDLRMGNYWGLHNRAEYILNRAGPGATLPATFSEAQGAAIEECGGDGSNWAINLDQYLDGSNNGYAMDCEEFGGDGTASATADTLVIRRASEAQPATLEANRVYLQTSRLQGALFVPTAGCVGVNPALVANAGCLPAGYAPPAAQTRQLLVHSYYVSTESTLRDDVPALRRKTFGNVNAADPAEAITDEEIVPGIEDLQVRFGIDIDGDTNIDEYRNPGDVPATAAVISATVWLRVRAEDIEVGHVDGNSYQYADMAAAVVPGDNYRRILVSKTILLRNTRT